MKLNEIYLDHPAPGDPVPHSKGRKLGSKNLPPFRPAFDENGHRDHAFDDKRPGHKALRAERDAEAKVIDEKFKAHVSAKLIPYIESLKQKYSDLRADRKTYDTHAKGRWTVYVPVEEAENVRNQLDAIMTEITGDQDPTTGISRFGNAWESVDFDMNFHNVACSISYQWREVEERKSRVEHLRFSPFAVFGIGYTVGVGFSDVSGRRHKGI